MREHYEPTRDEVIERIGADLSVALARVRDTNAAHEAAVDEYVALLRALIRLRRDDTAR